MYIPFNKISDSSRVWIFSAEHELSDAQIADISTTLKSFASNWQSHNQDVQSSFNIIEKRFVVIAADGEKSDISGCGIDKSMHIILEIEKNLGISLTNKSLLFFNVHGVIKAVKSTGMKIAVGNGEIKEDTLYYNTLATNMLEVCNSFIIPAGNSWLRKYFMLQLN